MHDFGQSWHRLLLRARIDRAWCAEVARNWKPDNATEASIPGINDQCRFPVYPTSLALPHEIVIVRDRGYIDLASISFDIAVARRDEAQLVT